MISPRIRIDQIDAAEWLRLRRLFLPGGAGGRRKPAAPLFLLVEGGRVVSAIRVPLEAGAPTLVVDPETLVGGGAWLGAASLPRIRQGLGARLAVALDAATALRIGEHADGQLSPGDDLVAQVLSVLRIGRSELGRGLHIDPDILSPVSVPSYAALQQTLDLLLPDERSAGLFVFDRGRLDTSIIVEKRRGDIARVTSHHALGVRINDFAGGRHKAVLEAMERTIARPHAAIFLTRAALLEVLGPRPGALAQAVALRDAVIDPAPSWLLAFTGALAVAGLAQGASKLLGRFVPQGIKDTARETARSLSPFTPLGFDPIKLFTDLQGLL